MRAGTLELATATALALALTPRHAGAAELVLEQPSACAVGDELGLRAERALGQPLASAPPVRCTIQIERAGDAFAAQMELSMPGAAQASGQRSFRAPTCELLADTLALAVALAVGESERDTPAPAVASAQHAAASAPGVAVPVASVPPLAVPAPTAALAPARAPESDAGARAARAARDDAAPHRSRWRWGGRAGLVADMGTLPELGLGPTLGAAWGVDWIEARASGTYLPAREASVSRPTASAEFGLLTAGLSVCTPRLLQGASLRAGLCLGGELGDMWGRARGFSVSRSGNALWRAGRFDVEARWALAPGVGLDLVLSALAPLERYRFVIEEFNPGFADPWYSALTLHRAQPVAARASLGLSVELGGRD